MDPKTTTLDPKLKEAYERIMGTTVPSPAQKTTPILNPQAPITPPTAKPTQTPQAPLPQAPKLQVQEVTPEPLKISTFEPPPPLPPNPTPQAPSNEMVQSPVFNPQKNPFVNPLPPPADIMGQDTNINAAKKKNNLKPIFLTLGGLIFFVIYGVVWAKVFNLF